MAEDKKLRHLMRGVKQELFAGLVRNPPRSVAEFRSEATTMEKTLQQRARQYNKDVCVASFDVGSGALPNNMDILREMVRSVVREELQKLQLAQSPPTVFSLADVVREEVRQVHIGNGLFICANKWRWVNQAKTDSTFAREVARCLWQPHELVGKSVTGKVCMRKLKEGGEAKPALTPEKLGAVRKSYEHFVAIHPSAVDTEARRLKDFNKHLATMLRDAK
ncbi:BEN domain-containing protein 5-like [Dermacentor albipictus]|uniref:BEN domain-containing protein 5-like n=1 Tax=Dermacentor albipictus TaxID=60249 RepID=UPI0038FC90E5